MKIGLSSLWYQNRDAASPLANLANARLVTDRERFTSFAEDLQPGFVAGKAQTDRLDVLFQEAETLAKAMEEQTRTEVAEEGAAASGQSQSPTVITSAPADLTNILSMFGWKGETAGHFAAYNGSGNAATLAEADEALAGAENWIFAYGGAVGDEFGAERARRSSEAFGMRARYLDDSPEDSPRMMVETLDEAGSKSAYVVSLNDIDAKNASLVETFALLTHLYMGKGNATHSQVEAWKNGGGTGAAAEYMKNMGGGIVVSGVMNDIVGQKKLDQSRTTAVDYHQQDGSVVTVLDTKTTEAQNRPGFEDRFDLLSLGKTNFDPNMTYPSYDVYR